MRWSVRLGRVNGVPVEIHWLFALLILWAAVEGWTRGRVAGLLYSTGLLLAVFGCIVLHEIGHSLQAQALGIAVRRILVMPFGGLAQLAHIPERPRDELRVAAAGPVVNLALALIAGGLLLAGLPFAAPALPAYVAVRLIVLRAEPGPVHFLAYLALVNAGLVVFNLLPAFPLDGGRIARSLLALLVPRETATRMVAGLGWALGIACVLLGLAVVRGWGTPVSVSLTFIGLTALLGTGAEEMFERSHATLQNIPVRAALRQPTWCLAKGEVIGPGIQATMQSLGRSVLPVAENGRVVGLITRRDLLAALARQPAATVGAVMQTDFVRIEADSDLWLAHQLLLGAPHEAVPVLDGDRLQGMLTHADILATFNTYPRTTNLEAPQLIFPSVSNL
jgi:Zn-dependent protease/predicted transcriptional regulator